MTDTREPILLDVESVSRANLKVVGGRQYWAHPSTHPICVCWHDPESRKSGVWVPGDRWPHRGRTLAAHNAMMFDRHGAERFLGVPHDAPWIDTSHQAKQRGYAGALDALGKLYGFPKDRDGSRFTRSLSTVRRPPGKDGISATEWKLLPPEEKAELGVQKAITPDVLDRVIPYCRSDVRIMRKAWPDLRDWVSLEPEVEQIDWEINDRGVPFDRDLARALLENDRANGDAVVREVARELGWSRGKTRRTAMSNQQFTRTTGAPNAQRATVDALDHPIARVRRMLATIAGGKLAAGLARCSDDGIMRDNQTYYAAHTGRWGGLGMQLQNMTRPTKAFADVSEADLLRVIDAVIHGQRINQAAVDWLLRSTIYAPEGYEIVAADLGAIEARVNCWFAGDERTLQVFRDGGDIYKVMASVIFGVRVADVTDEQRQMGKTTELACGYQMGVGLFQERGGTREAHKAWRKLHGPIVKWWSTCQAAWIAAAAGHVTKIRGLEFTPTADGRSVAIILPSGRPIIYRDARVSMSRTEWGAMRPSCSYLGRKGREHVYGGKIVENITQAFSRDVFVTGLLRAKVARIPTILTVHDEAVCLVPRRDAADGLIELVRAMTLPIECAPGLPLKAKGFHGPRYKKG
jgi:DNA polymerase bacteriophage-type